MKALFVSLTAALAVLLSTIAGAQESPKKKEGAKKRPEGARQFGPPPNPLFEALDANNDGEISSEEMSNAAAALKKLDRNGDGKLTRDEVRPAGGGFGGFGRGGAGFGGGPAAFVERIMSNDKNKDGKVTKDELPEQFAERMLERLDTNKDGAIDKAEAEKGAEGFGRGGRGGPGGPGGRPERPKRPSSDKERPSSDKERPSSDKE